MLLQEIADSKVPYEIIKNNASVLILESIIGDRTIRFFAENTSGDTGEDSWSVQFKEKTQLGKWTFNLTKSGSEFKVSAFVMEGMKLAVQLHSPNIIECTADTKERGMLYKRLFERFFKSAYTTYIRLQHDNGEYELRMVKN
jgi:hypothetical protein